MAKSLAIAYSMKKKKKKEYKEKDKSERDKGVHSSYPREALKGRSVAGDIARDAKEAPTKERWAQKYELAKALHANKLEELKEDKTDRKNLASGGTVESGDETMNYAGGGNVTCPSCAHTFSHGGQVANDTDFTADTLPNEFDDLVLRDDEEIGKSDTVSKVLAKRKK